MTLEDYLLKLSGYKQKPHLDDKYRWMVILSVCVVTAIWCLLCYGFVKYISDGISTVFFMAFFIAWAVTAYLMGNTVYKYVSKASHRYFWIAKLVTSVPDEENVRRAEKKLADRIMNVSENIPVEEFIPLRNACIGENGITDVSVASPYLKAIDEFCGK